MKTFFTIYLTFLVLTYSYSQTNEKISELKKRKNKIELRIQKLTDSISKIDLKISQFKSEKLFEKIKDSSLTAKTKKRAKLKNDSNAYAEIIVTFRKSKKVIILDYKNGYFEVCQGSVCGYMSEIWIEKNNSIREYMKLKTIEQKNLNKVESNSLFNKSSSRNIKSKKSNYKVRRYRVSRTYYRGPRGGCYYINSNGNKTYVPRNLCN